MKAFRMVLTVMAGAALAAADLGGGADAGPLDGAAPGGRLPADVAYQAAEAGEIQLIDIRTPPEWAETGAPAGARLLTLQAPEFGPTLLGLLRDPDQKPVALICATGRRTGAVMDQLRQMGLDHRAYDVSEGVNGSEAGPGWAARGLPVTRPVTQP